MSITTEIERIKNAKASIKTAIENKGVTVGDVRLDEYPSKIDEITTGGGDEELENSFISSLDDTLGSGCTKLPSNLTSIGSYAFYNCKNLALTSLPSGITSIGSYAFNTCTNLALTSLPDGIATIETYAFNNCPNLTLTNLPKGLTAINNYVFANCTNLALTSLPDGIISIGGYAFSNCTNLALTKLPEGLTTINNYVFRSCTNLNLTSLPSSLKTINNNAFQACSGLKKLDVLSEVTTFNIGNQCFYNCSNLTQIIFRMTTPPKLGTSVFANTPISSGTGYIYVPDESVEAYRTATNWSAYASQIKGISEL